MLCLSCLTHKKISWCISFVSHRYRNIICLTHTKISWCISFVNISIEISCRISFVSQRFSEGTPVADQDDRVDVWTLPAGDVTHEPEPGWHVQLPEGRQPGHRAPDSGGTRPDQHRVHPAQPAPGRRHGEYKGSHCPTYQRLSLPDLISKCYDKNSIFQVWIL